MKHTLKFIGIGIGICIVIALILTILGHFTIWRFTNSLNDNLFIAGIIGLGIALAAQGSGTQSPGAQGVLYGAKTNRPELHEGAEKNRLFVLLYFIGIFAGVCALSLLLPEIRF